MYCLCLGRNEVREKTCKRIPGWTGLPSHRSSKKQAPGTRWKSQVSFLPCQTGSAYLDQTGKKVWVCCFLKGKSDHVSELTHMAGSLLGWALITASVGCRLLPFMRRDVWLMSIHARLPGAKGSGRPGFLTDLSSGVRAGAKALATFTSRKPVQVRVCWMVPVSLTWTEVTISPAFSLFTGTHWQGG